MLNSHPSWRETYFGYNMLFSISKTRTRSCHCFSDIVCKDVCEDFTVRSLNYLNRCKVLFVYADITANLKKS